MSEIRMSETQTCLKSELLWVRFQTPLFVWKLNFWFQFQTHSVKKKCLKSELFGTWTVIECLKPILVRILDANCIWFATRFGLPFHSFIPFLLFYSVEKLISNHFSFFIFSSIFFLSSFLSAFFLSLCVFPFFHSLFLSFFLWLFKFSIIDWALF